MAQLSATTGTGTIIINATRPGPDRLWQRSLQRGGRRRRRRITVQASGAPGGALRGGTGTITINAGSGS
jgi:hypothetical protein